MKYKTPIPISVYDDLLKIQKKISMMHSVFKTGNDSSYETSETKKVYDSMEKIIKKLQPSYSYEQK